MTAPVIMVKKVGHDTTVFWYRTVKDATINRAVLSASARGVRVEGSVYLTTVPQKWVGAAAEAHEVLKANPYADVSHLATHRHGGGVSNGPIEKIKEA
jgi:(2Fe-2S) ferredoxin